jgi:hypothetical protein
MSFDAIYLRQICKCAGVGGGGVFLCFSFLHACTVFMVIQLHCQKIYYVKKSFVKGLIKSKHQYHPER